MFARTISMDQWAEVYEELECPRFGKLDDVAMVKGEHPHLGVVIAVQMMEDAISITTTVPFTDAIDRQMAEEGGAFARAVVADILRRRRGVPTPKASACQR